MRSARRRNAARREKTRRSEWVIHGTGHYGGGVESGGAGVLGDGGTGVGAGAGAGVGAVAGAAVGAGFGAPPLLAGLLAGPGKVGIVRLCFCASGITNGPF